jgi:hypothetical protein
VNLKSCPKCAPPVLDSGPSGEPGRWDIASLIGGQVANLSDEPVAVLVGQGQATYKRVWWFPLEYGQAFGGGTHCGDAGAALPQSFGHEVQDLGLALDHEDPNTVQTRDSVRRFRSRISVSAAASSGHSAVL